MNTLTLNGVPSDFVYQKGLDTVQKRHHVWLWKEPDRANVWLGAAAEDIGFRFELTHWTHATAPRIDYERAKVVNDLAFTRCFDAAQLVPRHSQDLLQDPKAERPILTDTAIAVVQLGACNNPRKMPGVEATSDVDQRGRLSHILTSLRNDLKLNVFSRPTTHYSSLPVVERYNHLGRLQASTLIRLDWIGSARC